MDDVKFKENLVECKSALGVLATLREELTNRKKAFELENEELLNKIEQASLGLDGIKETIKIDALAEFNRTNDKKLMGGIGIRVYTKLLYDVSTALSWAKSHSVAVALDKKAFENIAKDSKDEELGFVTKTHVMTVTFPKEIKIEAD